MPNSQKPRVKFVGGVPVNRRFVDTPRSADVDEVARQKEIELRKHERRERAEQNKNGQSVRKR